MKLEISTPDSYVGDIVSNFQIVSEFGEAVFACFCLFLLFADLLLT